MGGDIIFIFYIVCAFAIRPGRMNFFCSFSSGSDMGTEGWTEHRACRTGGPDGWQWYRCDKVRWSAIQDVGVGPIVELWGGCLG